MEEVALNKNEAKEFGSYCNTRLRWYWEVKARFMWTLPHHYLCWEKEMEMESMMKRERHWEVEVSGGSDILSHTPKS